MSIHSFRLNKKPGGAGTLSLLCLAIVCSCVQPIIAQTVLFNFDNISQYTPFPINTTSGGITAHLAGTGQGYSIQQAGTMGFTPRGFSGNVVYPSSVFPADLLINFSAPVSKFSIMYACQELACDDAATMRVTAFSHGTYVGTNTMVARRPGTWPVDTLQCTFITGFDSVVVHYDKKPPTCQDYGPIFMCDNMKVIPMPFTLVATITPSGTVSTCSGSPITLQANTGTGFVYQWYRNNVLITGATASSYATSRQGNYTVAITKGSAADTSAPTAIQVKPLPVALVTPSGTTTVCPGTVITLKAKTAPGYSYQWYRSGVLIAGAIDSQYITSSTGKFYARVTLNGCSRLSNVATINHYPAPSTTLAYTGSLNICSTGSVMLKAKVVTGYTYQWLRNALPIPGATDTLYVASLSGVYSYRATTINGCTAVSVSRTVVGCAGRAAEPASISRAQVFPNPTSGLVTVKFTADKSETYTLRVMDATGETVLRRFFTSEKGNSSQQVDLHGMPDGLYYISIEAFTDAAGRSKALLPVVLKKE